jgi:hypothetical protein
MIFEDTVTARTALCFSAGTAMAGPVEVYSSQRYLAMQEPRRNEGGMTRVFSRRHIAASPKREQ